MAHLNSTYFLLLIICVSRVCVFGLENDEEENNNDFDDISSKLTTEQMTQTSFQVPDEKWTSTALKDIAHYLRNYKFNEWDLRFYSEKPEENIIGYYDLFPIPILRSLHWKVYDNCEKSFYKCIAYLHSIIETVPFARKDDVVTMLNEKGINNATLVKTLNSECKEIKSISERSSYPFDSLGEKFQWRTTASYFMCWYTMLGTPALSMLGEACDNFANCLDPEFEHRNRDPRSDDRLSFACAMYSFCPDPCCSLKHIKEVYQCYVNPENPCIDENRDRHIDFMKCSMNEKENRDINAIIRNKWNVTCHCKRKGFVWKSHFGTCVDLNECLGDQNVCDNKSEQCINTPGSYRCICKWGYELDSNNKCIVSNLQSKFTDTDKHENNTGFFYDMVTKFIEYN